MAEVINCRLPGSAHRAGRYSGDSESLAQQFISSGIDDLAKYRVVRLLWEHQSLAGDAALYAAYLGFHSVEVTITLLDELVTSGILGQEDRGRGGLPRYRLADHGEMCRLAWLYNAPHRPSEHIGVLQILARRSLALARARASDAERWAHAAKGAREHTSLRHSDGIALRLDGNCSTQAPK